MTTIIVHGTMVARRADKEGTWWHHPQASFVRALDKGLEWAGGSADVWWIDDTDVGDHPGIPNRQNRPFMTRNGRFLWSGLADGFARRGGGEHLALYLNNLHAVAPWEPIRVVAHSHGCNVLKAASSHPALDTEIFIESAVFLACPHLTGTAMLRRGNLPYQLDPEVFGRILNLYTRRDSIQTKIAGLFGNPFDFGVFEGPPETHREDQDQGARHLYQNEEVPVEDSGKRAHSAMHGSSLGFLAGAWITHPDAAENALRSFHDLFPVASGDFGE